MLHIHQAAPPAHASDLSFGCERQCKYYSKALTCPADVVSYGPMTITEGEMLRPWGSMLTPVGATSTPDTPISMPYACAFTNSAPCTWNKCTSACSTAKGCSA